MEINSLHYKGDSRQHAQHWSPRQTESCVFGDGPRPCLITVAIGGASGGVTSPPKDLGVSADGVARVKLR